MEYILYQGCMRLTGRWGLSAAAQSGDIDTLGWPHLHIAHHILPGRCAPESKDYAPGAVCSTAPTDDCLPWEQQVDWLSFGVH